MIRAIIFDCFGVIITDALQAITDELRQHSPEKAERIHDLVLAANRGLIRVEDSNRQVAEILGISVTEYRRRIAGGEFKNQQLLDFVADLRAQYKTGMLSNVSGGGLSLRFTSEELERCFDAVVASGNIGFAKPEAEAYETIADKLAVRLEECIFIDDRESYCDAARGVGMQAILYKDFEQLAQELPALLADAKN